MIWADTVAVGCGITYCRGLKGGWEPGASRPTLVIVFKYGPRYTQILHISKGCSPLELWAQNGSPGCNSSILGCNGDENVEPQT